MSKDDANESSSGVAGIAGLKGVTLLGQSSTGSADRYYIQRRSGKVFGPFDRGLIRQMIEGEKLSGDEGVSQDKQVWLPILSVPDFADLFGGGGEEGGRPTLDDDPFGTGAIRASKAEAKLSEAGGDRPADYEPNVHEEPTRAFADSSVDDLMAGDASLPSLTDLPMPEPSSFEISNIPGLGDEASSFLPPAEAGDVSAPAIPELPPPPSFGSTSGTEVTRSLNELEPPANEGAVGDEPELPAPKSPRPSIRRSRPGDDANAELPIPKSAFAPELPRPKQRPGAEPMPELPAAKSASEPELPTPKSPFGSSSEAELPLPKDWSLPELPMPKGGQAGASSPELPRPKGSTSSSMPELPMPKSASEPELPTPKSSSMPELPTPKDTSMPELPTPRKGKLPELPMPRAATLPELPMPRRGQNPQLPLPKTDAELPTLADGFDLFGSNKLPELPTPKFEDVHLPGHHDEAGDSVDVDDLLGDFEDTLQATPGDLGTDNFSLSAPSQSPGDTFSGLDDDLLPPPSGDFGDDLLGDFEDPLGGARLLDAPGFAPPADDPAAGIPTVALEIDLPAPEDIESKPSAKPKRAKRAKPAKKKARAARSTRARRVPPSRVALLAVLLLALAGAGLYYAGFFDPSSSEGELPTTIRSDEPSDDDAGQVVVARTGEVDLSQLRPGNYGDYVGFLEPARAAAAGPANAQGRDAVARLLIGQALMAAQYGDTAVLVEDMGPRVEQLADSDEALHRLARGAVAAVHGDVEGANLALSDIEGGEHAAMAQLFLGIAEVERYERAVAAADAVELVPEPADAAPADGAEPEDETTEESGAAEASGAEPTTDDATAEATEPAEPTEPADAGTNRIADGSGDAELSPSAIGHLEQAVRLDPQLVPAHYFLGVAHEIRGDAEAAAQAYRAALEVEAGHYPSLLALSEVLIERGQLEEAGRHLVLVTEEAQGLGSDRERSDVHQLLGRVAAIQRDVDQAAQELERAFTTDPTNRRVLGVLSDLLLHTGQHERAIAFLEENAPDRAAADVVVALGRHRLASADAVEDEAREELLTGLVAELEAARSEAPGDPRFPYLLGLVRLEQNLFEEAEVLLAEAVEVDDQYRPAWVARAELARLSNELNDAIGYLQRAESVGEPDSELDTTIGDAYERLDRPASALAAYRRAVEVDSLNMQARLELARFEIQRGDRRSLQRAQRQLEMAEAAGVDDVELHALFAEVQYGLGNLNQARERMNRVAAVEADVADPSYLYLLGRINFDAGELALGAGQTEEAAEHFSTAEENFNTAWVEGFEESTVRYWEARALLAQGEIDRAVLLLRRAIDQALRDGEPHGAYQFWLGYAYEELSQSQAALESYVVADQDDLRWALAHPDLYYRRGRLFARSRLFRRAKRDLEWTLILQPNNAGAAHELAEVHAMERNDQSALALWHRSLEIDPGQPRVHYRLGMTYLRLENHQEAIRHFEQARDMGYGGVEPGLFRTLGFLYKDARRNREAVRELVRYLDTGAVPPGSAEETEIQREIERLGGRY